ncbi:hypothetical protein AVEN_93060-1 [Araneus ventricosus]|uniref:Uncharacterized protein n=1 Tax=Araneus ventricosus TaxID=182803 RepID=A0A4Y2PXF1_ARAVE|nr:hypothetical protein AVEN_93060-1 [Araneus ventricosus]
MPRAGNCLSLVGLHGGRCCRDPNFNLHCMGSKKKSRQDSASSTELDRVARYVRFLIISACDKEKGLCLSPFAVQKELKSIGDDPKTVKKLKSGDLLIETFSAIQTKSFLLAKTLANTPITVEPHKSLNSCRGVISEIQLQNTPENEIFEGLSDQNVIHVRRIILEIMSELFLTKHLILTFSGTNLPDSIKAGYLRSETETDEKLTNVHVPPLTLLKASNPKQQCSKMTFGTGSNDLSNFTTGKKKKANKPSTSVTVTENKTNSVVASKFWKTSPLQVSNPVSVSNSPKSKANAEGVTVDNRTLPSATTTEPEPMTTDVSIHSSDNETESDNAIEYNPHLDNAIEYNPHETIDETPPALQQQPSTSTTVADKSAFKQRVKKCPVRWVDFKEFYNAQKLSTPVHNKYLKKHQIKRLQ